LDHATGKTKYEDAPAGEIAGVAGVLSIGVGEDHACALRSDRTVWCWGDNRFGELGDGTLTARLTPAKVQGLERVAALSVGSRHACALLDDGTVSCWGQARYGEVGTYATDDVTTPSAVLW
jgi:alpha-tubulin suppressor-like RCC1 family protein